MSKCDFRRKDGKPKIFIEIIKIFPNLTKTKNLHMQKSHQNSYRINT